jgi:hypothetical protein
MIMKLILILNYVLFSIVLAHLHLLLQVLSILVLFERAMLSNMLRPLRQSNLPLQQRPPNNDTFRCLLAL